jgi:ferredoxin
VVWFVFAPLIACAASDINRDTRRTWVRAWTGGSMPFVIAEPCIGVKDKSCVEVCPVNCIYEGEDQYYIHPDECIDCQACEAACPVQAIFPDNTVPEKWLDYIEKNRAFFENQ